MVCLSYPTGPSFLRSPLMLHTAHVPGLLVPFARFLSWSPYPWKTPEGGLLLSFLESRPFPLPCSPRPSPSGLSFEIFHSPALSPIRFLPPSWIEPFPPSSTPTPFQCYPLDPARGYGPPVRSPVFLFAVGCMRTRPYYCLHSVLMCSSFRLPLLVVESESVVCAYGHFLRSSPRFFPGFFSSPLIP